MLLRPHSHAYLPSLQQTVLVRASLPFSQIGSSMHLPRSSSSPHATSARNRPQSDATVRSSDRSVVDRRVAYMTAGKQQLACQPRIYVKTRIRRRTGGTRWRKPNAPRIAATLLERALDDARLLDLVGAHRAGGRARALGA